MNANTATASAFSIVIASWSGENALRRCLESLLPQVNDAEVIVALRGSHKPAFLGEERFRKVRFVSAPDDATVFQLRSTGVHESHAASIALIEDHSVVAPGWLRAMMSARAAGWLICGGPIENDSESSGYDWALYFAEYGRFMPPVRTSEATVLSGVNIFYDRDILWSCRSIWESRFYESDVNDALINAGHKLHLISDALVTSRLRMGFAEAMKHLFSGGLHFGNFRAVRSDTIIRWLWLISSPAVPVVTLFRIIRITIARQPQRSLQLVRSFFYLLLLLGAWSLGEATGYLKCAKGSDANRH
jgi:glycosyltransferase involved in cell wall biosynthesis